MPYDVASIGPGKPVLGRHISDLYTSLTGAMPDQPITLASNLTVGGVTLLSRDPIQPLEATPKQWVESLFAGHTAASDPHPQYLTASEADALFLTQAEADALYAPVAGGGYLTPGQADLAYVNVTGDVMSGALSTPQVTTPTVQSTAANLTLGSNGSLWWRMTLVGRLEAVTDDAQDIGQVAAGRPRDIYAARTVNVRNVQGNPDEALYLNAAPGYHIFFSTGGTWPWLVHTDGRFLAGADNVVDIGASTSNRPRTIYAATSVVTPLVESPLTLVFKSNGTNRWSINNAGHLLAIADNVYDIGASGTTRPRNIYAGGSFQGNGAVPPGGGAGQVLTKSSVSDYALIWSTVSGGGGLDIPTADSLYVNLTGDTMTGRLSVISGTYAGAHVGQIEIGTTDNASRGYLGYMGGSWNYLGIWGSGQGLAGYPTMGFSAGAIVIAAPINELTGPIRLQGRTDIAVGTVITGGTALTGTALQVSGIIEQRNGLNPQTLRIYNKYVTSADYERVSLQFGGGGPFFGIAYERAGSGSASGQVGLSAYAVVLTSSNNTALVSSGGITLKSYDRNTWGFGWNEFYPTEDNQRDIGTASLRPRNLYLAGTATVGDGTAAAPSLNFGSEPPSNRTGFYLRSGGQLGVTVYGTPQWFFHANGLFPETNNAFDIGSDTFNLRPRNLYLAGIAKIYSAGTAAAPALQLSPTAGVGLYVDSVSVVIASGSVGRWMVHDSGGWLAVLDNTYDIGYSATLHRPRNLYLAGTAYLPTVITPLLGSATDLSFVSGNFSRWQMLTAGHFTPSADNAYDIGLNAVSNRPRNLYLAGAAHVATGIYSQQIGTFTNSDFAMVSNDTVRWKITNAGHLLPNTNATEDLGGSSNRVLNIWAGGNISTWGALSADGGMETYGTNIFNGNVYFQGTGQRVLGNFSQSTPANNTMYQTRSSNSQTVVAAMPSGSSRDAAYRVYNTSDPNNSAFMQMVASSTDVGFTSDKEGVASVLPFRFGMAGANAFRIETTGQVNIQAHRLRLEGWGSNPTGGKGLEMGYDTTADYGLVWAYDRATPAYKDLHIIGKSINITPSGGGSLVLPAGSVTTPMLAANAATHVWTVQVAPPGSTTSASAVPMPSGLGNIAISGHGGGLTIIRGILQLYHSAANGPVTIQGAVNGAGATTMYSGYLPVAGGGQSIPFTIYSSAGVTVTSVQLYWLTSGGTLNCNSGIYSFVFIEEFKK